MPSDGGTDDTAAGDVLAGDAAVDGILVVEDIPDYEWTQKMLQEIPPSLVKSTFIIDRRHVNGRYDDIMLFVDKGRAH